MIGLCAAEAAPVERPHEDELARLDRRVKALTDVTDRLWVRAEYEPLGPLCDRFARVARHADFRLHDLTLRRDDLVDHGPYDPQDEARLRDALEQGD